MPAPRKYPNELRERAQWLVAEAREQGPGLSLTAAVRRIGPRVGVQPDTLWGLVQAGRHRRRTHSWDTTTDATRIRKLERENRELKRANEILLAAFSFFRAGARPATFLVAASIAAHRERFGVEQICRVLTEHSCRISPSGYYACRSRLAPARAVRDEVVLAEIVRVHADPTLGRSV